ncbi:MAG: dockerin type I repeat-containing protein, partial [Bacteroidaceae bacterium]|nr:dockerin type I repeat-containing protein [Bacteroidaceae bacterium]
MKKIYSLVALFAMMIAAVGVSAQKYSMDTQAELPEAGVKYVLYNTSRMIYAGSTSNGCTEQIVDDSNLWEFEKTGNSIDGYDLYRIKSVSQNAYWQEIDFEGNLGLDGYDVFGYIGCNAAWGPAATAMEVTIAVADGAEERTTGSGTGGVIIMRKDPVAQDAETTWYYKLDTQSSGVWQVAFTPWNEGNVWQLWTVRENSAKDKLGILVDQILEEGLEFTVGTEPGFYLQEKVDAYQAVFDDAEKALASDLSDEEYAALFEKLSAAYEKIKVDVIPITAGYYYIVSAFDQYFEQQGVEKAVYGKDAVSPAWKDFDPANYAFLWKIDKKGDGFTIKNVLYDAFIHGSATNGNSQNIAMAATTDRTTYFDVLGLGQWKIYNSFCSIGYHTNGHGGGAGKGSNLVTWNPEGTNNGSAWYLRTVTDQEYINGAINQHAQQAIQDELKGLITEAGTLYDALFVIDADLDNPLVTEADDSKAPGEEGNQFLYNRPENSEGRYAALIDGNVVATYDANGEDTGSPTNYDANGEWAYFHGSWSGSLAYETSYSGESYDFMQVDLSKTPVSSFVLRTCPRYNNTNGQASQMTIYATNDTTGFYNKTDVWKEITTIYPAKKAREEFYVSPLIELGAEYKYIRFTVDKTYNDVRYIVYSEFNLFPGTISQELSQYYSAGMPAAADAMKKIKDGAAAAIKDNNATEQQVADLKAAIAAVRELYADPSELPALISKAEKEIEFAVVGDEMGNIKTEKAVTDYTEALATAQGYDLEGKLVKEELDAVVNGLKNARKAFLNDMVAPEEGKWYYISNIDETREGDSYTHGASIYTEGVGVGSTLHWGANESGEFEGQAVALWRVIPVADAETPNTVYVQNMATGLYLGGESVKTMTATTLSSDPVAFTLTYTGNSGFAICATENNTSNLSLHAQVNGKSVVGWNYNMGGVDANGTPSNTASLWTFVEAAELEGITVPVVAGELNVKVLPFAVSDIAEVNEGIKTYAVANIEEADGVSTISLYEKNEFAAGEPFILETPAAEDSLIDLVVYLPEDVKASAGTANGLVGVIADTEVPAGVGIYTAEGWVAAEEGASVPAQTGYINPAKFTGAVADVTVAKTIEIAGLKGAAGEEAGDVNGDGEINSSDVVSIYNAISGEGPATGADVNGDGAINSADAVAVYNIISGASAGAPSFVLPGEEVVEASEIIEPDNNTDAIISCAIGSSDDLTKIPFTISLTNSIDITAVEGNVRLPGGLGPDKVVYSEDDEDFVYDASARWKKTHALTAFAGTEAHGQDAFFFSIVSSKSANFNDAEGAIVT